MDSKVVTDLGVPGARRRTVSGGVLERLREEAQVRETRAAVSRVADRARRQLSQQKVLPRLGALRRYFCEFEAHLQVVAPEIRSRYAVPGLGTLDALQQEGYRVVDLPPEGPAGFRFRFDCARAGHLRAKVSAQTLAVQRERLAAHGLRFRIADQGRAGGVLVVHARVPVELCFHADLDRGVIALRVTNLEALGSVRYTLAPERIDSSLMDELARWVLREPNEFRAFSGNALSASSHARLRERLDVERLRKTSQNREAAAGRRLTHGFLRTLKLDHLWPIGAR